MTDEKVQYMIKKPGEFIGINVEAFFKKHLENNERMIQQNDLILKALLDIIDTIYDVS